MHLERWLSWGLGLLLVAFALFAVPSQVEGPVLLRISSGHAIAVLDAVAIIPLLVASALLYGGVWGARARLLESRGVIPIVRWGLASPVALASGCYWPPRSRGSPGGGRSARFSSPPPSSQSVYAPGACETLRHR